MGMGCGGMGMGGMGCGFGGPFKERRRKRAGGDVADAKTVNTTPRRAIFGTLTLGTVRKGKEGGGRRKSSLW